MNRFLIMLGSVLSLIPGLTTAQDAELHQEKSKHTKNGKNQFFGFKSGFTSADNPCPKGSAQPRANDQNGGKRYE